MSWAPSTVEEYLASFPKETRVVLEQVRATIRTVLPDATEVISYGIPTFELDGHPVVYFAGWKHHISLYPVPAGDAAYGEAAASYLSGKGTLRFPLARAIPFDLVARTAQLQAALTARGASPAD
ncbi:MAG TPA: DUF1801 domain-containing protein [Pedococcus sp.]|nr:DUF1801 domain-containing protein [Pedococcus sp.]